MNDYSVESLFQVARALVNNTTLKELLLTDEDSDVPDAISAHLEDGEVPEGLICCLRIIV